jgi:predicted XRE-type DNA-binding protein
MPIHAKMMEKQKAQDAEIDKLLAMMNSATGEQRIDAIVAVINKLVEQRKTMHAEMAAHLDK